MELESLRIEQLHLQVPGLSREEARQLGEELAQRLASDLPHTARAQQLGSLLLRISLPPGTPKDRLAERIAEQILSKLQ